MLKNSTLLLVLALSACGPASNDPGPGGVSVEDAQALDAAADKLDREPQVPPPQSWSQ